MTNTPYRVYINWPALIATRRMSDKQEASSPHGTKNTRQRFATTAIPPVLQSACSKKPTHSIHNITQTVHCHRKGAQLNLLTYSTVHSPFWEANWFAASQEIPRISRNPKVHYRTHKRPPPVSILGQPNPIYIPTSLLLEIHPNITHTSKPTSPHWSPSLRFLQQDPIHPPLLTHTRHMPSPSHFLLPSTNLNFHSTCLWLSPG